MWNVLSYEIVDETKVHRCQNQMFDVQENCFILPTRSEIKENCHLVRFLRSNQTLQSSELAVIVSLWLKY